MHDPLTTYLDLPPIPTSHVTPTPTRSHTTYELEADMFTFLSFLNRQDHAVAHGRWLPPRVLRSLNTHLSPPDNLRSARSELQAARIPFLHYLAERAGLVGLIGDWLKPTLIAPEWLAVPLPQRMCVLWDAWREPSDDNRALWRRYRLPALQEDDDPVARFQTLLETLAACPVGPLGDPAHLLDALVECDPALLRPQASYAAWAALDPDVRVDFEACARVLLLTLLTGPLTWFGILDTRPMGAEATGHTGKSADQRSLPPCPSAPLVLTSLGAVLLGRDDGDWPADPAPTRLHVTPLLASSEQVLSTEERTDEPAITLDAPPGLPLPDRFALEAIVPPDPDAPGRYRLTAPHLLRALQRGHTIEGVIDFLERSSSGPLPAPVLGALYRWGEESDRVAIRQALLLQAREPGVLRDLTAQRRIRETLGATLNARTVEVHADRLDALLRRLARRGIIPRLDLPHPHPGPIHEREEPSPPAPLPGRARGAEGEQAAIVVALRVYAHLADALGLPTRPAYALARRWGQGLPLPLRDAVERTVDQTLQALHRTAPLEMEDHLPEPTGPLLDALEAAIQEQAVVEIEYYTAGRIHRTTRRVEPLRLEWHGDVVYLIAYCHLRGDQRVFRVDRIERMENGEGKMEGGERKMEKQSHAPRVPLGPLT